MTQPYRPLMVALLGLGLTAGVYAQIRKPQGNMPSPETQQQLEMAMENMAKVMLDTKMEDRPGYMMKAQEEASARGQALFNNADLGRNGQTCNSCHPGGGSTAGEAEVMMKGRFPMNPKLPIPSLVGAAATFPKYKVPNDAVVTLATMNNNCVKMFLMGEGLPLDGQESRDLAAYVSSFSNGEEVAVGQMQMMQR